MLSPTLPLPGCSPPPAPFSSRTRNALAIFLAFAVPAHRGVLVVVVVGALGGLFRRRDFKEGRGEERREGRKGVVASVVERWCECGTCTSICAFVCGECDRARLAHKLRDAAATDVSLPLPLPPSLTAPRRLTGLSGTIHPVLSCWEESADLFYPPFKSNNFNQPPCLGPRVEASRLPSLYAAAQHGGDGAFQRK